MLSKLLKYELRGTARFFIPLYLTILVFAVINSFSSNIFIVAENIPLLYSLLMSLSMFVYGALMVGLVIMTLFVMIQRFYKNLLGDEGYLMFTLPVSSEKHIFSKLTVSMFWTIASSIVAIFSIFIIFSRNVFTLDFLKELTMAITLFIEHLGGFTYIFILEGIVLILLSLASTILNIYAAIALGHLYNKNKLLISFAMYILLNMIPQILIVLASFFFFIFNQEVPIMPNFIPSAHHVNYFLLGLIVFTGVITIGYFILTNYILKRRLNLE